MQKLPLDINKEKFGDIFLSHLRQYGFGILSKSDLEAVLLHAITESSKLFREANSYQRAEMLQITDQKYRGLRKRAGLWLEQPGNHESEIQLLNEFLCKALRDFMNNPDSKEVRVLVDDEIERRNLQKALERDSSKNNGIPIEISLTGRSLVLRGSDLEQMIDKAKKDKLLDKDIKDAIADKTGFEMRQAFLNHLKSASVSTLKIIASILISQAAGTHN